MDNIRINPTIKGKTFAKNVKNDWVISVTPMKCYRAKKKALEEISRTNANQYTRLWEFYDELRDKNQGSSALLLVERAQLTMQPTFKRAYFCIDACKKGFLNGIRPIIRLDGCHLIGPIQGQILIAIAYNRNDIMYPLTFVITESECKDSWKWFLENLFNDISSIGKHRWTLRSDQ